MQSTNTERNSNTPGPNERFAAIKGWISDRPRVTNYMSVFAACGEQFTPKEETLIRSWWNAKSKVLPKHTPIVERLDRAVEFLKSNPKQAA